MLDASLSQLLKFPFTCIKIDRSFVSGIGHADDRTEIVRAILSQQRPAEAAEVAEAVEAMVIVAVAAKSLHVMAPIVVEAEAKDGNEALQRALPVIRANAEVKGKAISFKNI